MSDSVLTVLFWVGVVLLSAFIVAGLASRKVRTVLQRPADDMIRRDRARWGGQQTEDQGGEE